MAAQEQAEAQQMPCLTVVTASREFADAVLDMDGAVGGMIVAANQGNVALQNMGNGPAVNVHYKFDPVGPPQEQTLLARAATFGPFQHRKFL